MFNIVKPHEHRILIARQNNWNTPATTNFYELRALVDGLVITDELNKIKENVIIGQQNIEASKVYVAGVGGSNLYKVKIKLFPTTSLATFILNFAPKNRVAGPNNIFFEFASTPHKINYTQNEGRFCTLVIQRTANFIERYINGIVDSFSINYDFGSKEAVLEAEFVFTNKSVISIMPNASQISDAYMTLDAANVGSNYAAKELVISENFNVKYNNLFYTYENEKEITAYIQYTASSYDYLEAQFYGVLGNLYIQATTPIKVENVIQDDILIKKINFANITYTAPFINNI